MRAKRQRKRRQRTGKKGGNSTARANEKNQGEKKETARTKAG